MKLHDTALKGVLHKVPNIHAPDKRDLFFLLMLHILLRLQETAGLQNVVYALGKKYS